MKTIWKFPLDLAQVTGDGIGLSMPKGAEFLTVQAQYGVPTLWALVDTDQPKETRLIAVEGTGDDLGHVPKRYLGTTQQHGGALVLHYFEEK